MAKTSAPSKMNAISLLKEDHKKVKELFEKFEKTENAQTKKKIAEEAINDLKIHAQIEEEIFYKEANSEIGDEENLLNEAKEEHHVAKMLIAELDQLDRVDEVYEAKFTVLAENVRHHIKEEEGELFPEVKKSDLELDEMGQRMFERKQELMKSGVPASAEEELVSASR
jgi:hemerythrin-like domain-containing protein